MHAGPIPAVPIFLMPLVVCVAEKNSIARGVAEILSGGGFESRTTADKYTRNYVFRAPFAWLGGAVADVVVTAVRGHLTELCVGEGYAWGAVDPYVLFDCPLEFQLGKGMEGVAANLRELGARADFLMVWTDCDREGEFIGAEVAGVAGFMGETGVQGGAHGRGGNPPVITGGPQGPPQKLLRASFSHLGPAHVRHAANSPVALDRAQVAAVKARMEIDLRTGYAFTRLLTGGLGNLRNLEGQGGRASGASSRPSMISFGNCQFPTLGFVVDRFTRIANFSPQATYTLSIAIGGSGPKKLRFTWSRGRVLDRLVAVALYQSCLNTGTDARVESLKDSPTSNWAPLPLTTVELQKECSRIFKFSAKDTLAVAEKLYQRGLVSYPRTETDVFPRGMDMAALIQIQTESPTWGAYAQNLLSTGPRPPRAGRHNDEAHPPIHPVGHASDLTGKDAKVYEFIVRRFLACCSPDAKGQKRVLVLNWGGETFSATGLVVTARNYLEVYPYAKWDSNGVEIPHLALGQTVALAEAKLQEGHTAPPRGLTETELIALMDLNGIGTDATIADHIEKILTRGYIAKLRRKTIPYGAQAKIDLPPETGRGAVEFLMPTKLGLGLAQGFAQLGLENISLTKPFLRREMEQSLAGIASGARDPNRVVADTINTYKEIYTLTQGQLGRLKSFVCAI